MSTILLAAVLWWIIRSPWGRAFAALRDNPIRAESLGVNIMAYTLLAFAIGAAFAGIAGAYFAALVQFIEPGPFHLVTSLMMLLMVIVGGSGRFFGPMLGAAIVILLPEWLRVLKDWYLVMFGLAVVAMMIWLPGGCYRYPNACVSRSENCIKHYGAIRAVDGVSFSVGPGEIVGVIGPNGSGKTTLFNSILGQIKPTSGRMRFMGEDITGMSPLALSPRRRPHLPDPAGIRQPEPARQPDRGGAGVRARHALAPLRRARRGSRRAGRRDDCALRPGARRASAGGQPVLRPAEASDIAMAFMPRPRLVLLDEPCAGVNPGLVDGLRELLLR